MINAANWLSFFDFWISKGHVYLALIVEERGLAFQGEKGSLKDEKSLAISTNIEG